jgi:hypothetical protein
MPATNEMSGDDIIVATRECSNRTTFWVYNLHHKKEFIQRYSVTLTEDSATRKQTPQLYMYE